MKKASERELWLQLVCSHFPAFVAAAFRELHPGSTLSNNLAVALLVDAMSKVAAGLTSRLLVNIPPRSLKSFICSVAFIAFMLGRNPNLQILLIAGNVGLRKELLDKLHRLMSSSFYRAAFPHVVIDARSGQREIKLRHGGYVRTAVISDQHSGRGADIVVTDDPSSPVYAQDKAARDGVNAKFDAEILTRLNDRATGTIIVLMQRVHKEDLSGHLLKSVYDFDLLAVPAVALWDECWKLSNGKTLTRKRGEVIDPGRESREQLLQRLHEMGGYNFNGQYLQGKYGNWDENESRMRVLMHELRASYTIEIPPPPMAFYRVYLVDEIMRKVFDIPRLGPPLVPYVAPNLEHWEYHASRQQAALVGSVSV